MPTYRLELKEDFDHGDGVCGAGPIAVWLRANDAADARLKMELATIMEPERYPECQLLPYRAWFDSIVIACNEDGSRAVPEGVLVLGDGKTLKL